MVAVVSRGVCLDLQGSRQSWRTDIRVHAITYSNHEAPGAARRTEGFTAHLSDGSTGIAAMDLAP